jgi:LysR family transcriptional regulator, hydrogen peroxide-inducible genes activator
MISITQIEYILAVDRLRHFGKASAFCNVAQPSLSLQIQKAEEQLGYLLFDRDKKPTEPTAKGRGFLEQARVVLAEHQKLMHDAQSEKGLVRGDFELGVIPTIMPYLIPLIIGDFSKRFPLVNLKIRELTTELCISGIRHQTLDAAIVSTPLQERGIKERILYFESFFLYAHPQSEILKIKHLKPEDIQPNDLWLLMDGHCLRNQVLNFCSIKRSQLSLGNIQLLGGSLEVLRQVVNGSWGYTLIPEMMKDSLPISEKETQVRPFSKSLPTREISLVFAREQWKLDILNAIQSCVSACLPRHIAQKPAKSSTVLNIYEGDQ